MNDNLKVIIVGNIYLINNCWKYKQFKLIVAMNDEPIFRTKTSFRILELEQNDKFLINLLNDDVVVINHLETVAAGLDWRCFCTL
jgi:hypothetical protein